MTTHLEQRAHGRAHVDVQPLRVHRIGIRLAAHERRDGQYGAARLAARRCRVLAAAGAAGRPAQARACAQNFTSHTVSGGPRRCGAVAFWARCCGVRALGVESVGCL